MRQDLDVFARFVETTLGIRIPPAKHAMLEGRLGSRMRALALDSLGAYRRHVFDSPEGAQERIHLLDAVTTNKTEFFREAQHFDYLRDQGLDAVLGQRRTRDRLNVWCAGCSTGEEAYTLAMLLAEHRARVPSLTFAILATDVSTRVLESARLGIYTAERTQRIPPALRQKYLLRSKDPRKALARVRPELRQHISFHHLNFMDASYRLADTYDVVFFRNVAIYFSLETQRQVVNRIVGHLDAGGFLFSGLSESFNHAGAPLVSVAPGIYRRT